MPEGTATLNPPQASQSDSWADLSEASPSLEPATVVEDKKPNTPGICPVCGEEIVREPGTRGRLPKYHAACKPVGGSGGNGGGTGAGRRSSSTKANQEADICVAQFRGWAIKACIMLATVDRYDAFTVMVGLQEVCNNLKGVLLRYDTFRKEWLAMQGGGSVIGLALSVIMIILPIAAHHKLIPSAQLSAALVQTPHALFKIQQQLKNGEENLTKLMQEQAESMLHRPGQQHASNGQKPE